MLNNTKCEYCCNLYDQSSEYNFELHQTKCKSQHEIAKSTPVIYNFFKNPSKIIFKPINN
jgi:hypothetical protein